MVDATTKHKFNARWSIPEVAYSGRIFGRFFLNMSNKEQFWVDNGRCKFFDFDALYQSLSDGPMTDAEKQMVDETWRKSSDFILKYFEDDRLTTKEGFNKLENNYSLAYHREECAAGLG